MENQRTEMTKTTTVTGSITITEGDNAAEVHEINLVIDPTSASGQAFVIMTVTPTEKGFTCDGAIAGQTHGVMRAINTLVENLPPAARMKVLQRAISSGLSVMLEEPCECEICRKHREEA